MKKLGLVGFGKWGENYIASSVMSRQAEISMICRRDLKKFSTDIAHNHYITDSFDDLLNAGLDGIILASGPDSHIEFAHKCIDRRIPFMVEKPLGLNYPQCIDLIDRASSKGTPFHINHVHLYAPAYLKLRETVRSWKSRNLHIMSRGMSFGPFREYDAFSDYAPHDVSMILGLFDEPDWVNLVGPEIEQTPNDLGEIYRLAMYSPWMGDGFLNSTSWLGNGAESKYRSFIAIDMNNGDYANYFYSNSKPILDVNGQHQLFDDTQPLVCSLRAFCDLIGGKTDWRNAYALYSNIYKIAIRS
jgi:predicted dehydrogenase